MKTFSLKPMNGKGPARTVSIQKSPDLSVFNQTSSEAEFAEVAAFFSSPMAFAENLILSRSMVQSPYAFIAHSVWMQVAGVPVIAERRVGEDSWERIQHPAVDRLNKPNADPESDACSFIGELLTSVFNSGEYRVWKLGADGGTERDPLSMIVIPPGEIIPTKFDPMGRATLWQWTPSGPNTRLGTITIPSGQLMSYKEFRNPWEPNRGVPRSHPAAWSLRSDFYARRHNASLAKNSGRTPGAFLYDPDRATTKDLENQKRLFEDTYGGTNAGSTAHLTANKYEKMMQTAQEMDWIEGAKMTREEILLLWSVYPETQGFGETTFANREAAERAQWENALIPIANKAVIGPISRLYEMDPDRERLRFMFDENIPALRSNQEKEARTQERNSRAFLNLVQGGATVESAAEQTGFDLAAAPAMDPTVVQAIQELDTSRGDHLVEILSAVDQRIALGLEAVENQLEATRRSIPLEIAPVHRDPTDPEPMDDPDTMLVRELVWRNLDSQAAGYDRRVRGTFSRFLNEQRRRVLQSVDALNPSGAASFQALEALEAIAKNADPSPADMAAAESIFNMQEENRLLREAMAPVLEDIVRESGRLMEIELDGMGIPGDADTALPEAQAAALQNLEFINRTTLRSLAVAVMDAQEEPEPDPEKGIAEVVSRVAEAVRGVYNRAKKARAKLVAEMTAGQAMNAARIAVTKIRRVPENEWISQRDDRVRDSEAASHVELDGTRAAPGETFKAGITLRYPHDPMAPIQQTARCRCYTIPRIPDAPADE